MSRDLSFAFGMDGSDAELVVAAARGDHDAFTEIYDRYAARIYDLCAHMLRNRDDAADATAEVFVKAHGHLAQLREPEKCKSWLYAIARNEVYRRTRRRARETVVDMSDDVIPAASNETDDALDPAALAGVVREAALGLDERDRLVLELTLAGGLEGRELGDALGLSENGAHQAAHRMRERLGRSVGALLVARQGRADCAELAALLEPWDGTFSVLWRKRVARHVDSCETCERRRKLVPAALFSGTAFAAMPISHLSPPDFVRERVLERTAGAPTSTNAIGWKRDGFPTSPDKRKRAIVVTTLVAAIIAVVLLAAGVAGGSSEPNRVAVGSPSATTSPTVVPEQSGSTTSTTKAKASTTTVAGQTPVTSGGTAPVVVPPTDPATHQPGPTVPGQPVPPTTAPPQQIPPTTTPPDTTGPTLDASIPSAMGEGTCPGNPPLTATASDPSGVNRVNMTYRIANIHSILQGPVGFAKSGPNSWSLTWNVPSNGGATTTYWVYVHATDGHGNETTESSSVTVGACLS